MHITANLRRSCSEAKGSVRVTELVFVKRKLSGLPPKFVEIGGYVRMMLSIVLQSVLGILISLCAVGKLLN